jgi:hypothetical protein
LPIYVKVTIDGERAEWTCQRNCDPRKWNQQAARAIGNKDETKSLNQYLDALDANIFAVQKEYALRNEPITANQVRSKVLHQTDESNTHLSKFISTTMISLRNWYVLSFLTAHTKNLSQH